MQSRESLAQFLESAYETGRIDGQFGQPYWNPRENALAHALGQCPGNAVMREWLIDAYLSGHRVGGLRRADEANVSI